MSRCPLCGTEREAHACSNVPPAPPEHVLLESARKLAANLKRVPFAVDPRRRGGSW